MEKNYQFTGVPTNLFMMLDNNCRSMLFTMIQLSSYYADEEGWFFRTYSDLEEESNLSHNLVKATIQTLFNEDIIDARPTGFGSGRKPNYYKVNFENFEKYEKFSIEEAMKNPDLKIATVDYKGSHFKLDLTKKVTSTVEDTVTSRVEDTVTSRVTSRVKSDNKTSETPSGTIDIVLDLDKELDLDEEIVEDTVKSDNKIEVNEDLNNMVTSTVRDTVEDRVTSRVTSRVKSDNNIDNIYNINNKNNIYNKNNILNNNIIYNNNILKEETSKEDTKEVEEKKDKKPANLYALQDYFIYKLNKTLPQLQDEKQILQLQEKLLQELNTNWTHVPSYNLVQFLIKNECRKKIEELLIPIEDETYVY